MFPGYEKPEGSGSFTADEVVRERVRAAERGDRGGRFFSLSLRRRGRRGRIEGPSLIEALHTVAAASASGLDIEDALAAIVEQAKLITNTDKAILCLLEAEPGALHVDAGTVVVRGARAQHPESWWTGRVEDMAAEVLATGTVVVTRDREEGAWLACAPAPSKGGPIGILCAINAGRRSFTPDETNFLGILGAFAASALENARLAEQARHSLLAGERDRIAREMHDGLAQSLFSASLGLEVCKKRLDRDPADAAERVADVQQVISDSLAELRHYIYDLRSPRLERLGLAEAVRAYITDVTKGTGREADLTVRGKERSLDDAAESCLYRVAREAVTNAVRHSACRHIRVVIDFAKNEVILTVRDDGDGFDVQKAFAAANKRGSLGLRNIRDRVRAAGGEAEIASSRRAGTYVRARVPS